MSHGEFFLGGRYIGKEVRVLGKDIVGLSEGTVREFVVKEG